MERSKNGDHSNTDIFHSYQQNKNLYKALIVAEYLGPEFFKMNPIRDIPALLQTLEGSVFESNAIAHYVAHRSFLLGSSKFEYAQIQQWIDFSSFELDANIRGWIMPRLGYATYIKPVEESCIDGLKRGLDALNKYLASHTHLVCDYMTLADIITTCNLLLAFKLLTPKSFTSEYPHVERYFWTMVNQPKFSKIMGEVKQTEAVLPLPSAKKPEAKPPSKMVSDDWKRLYSNTKSNFREGMAPTFYVGSVAGLKKLDEYLLSRSYISGYQASKDDLKVHAAFTNAPSAEYVNLCRWFNHVEELSQISVISAEGSGVTAIAAKLMPGPIKNSGLKLSRRRAGEVRSCSGRRELEEEERVGVTVEGSASFPEEAIATPPVADTKKCDFANIVQAADEDDDSDVDLFGEETEEERVGVTVEGSASFPEEAIATPPVADTKAAADEDDDSDVDLFGEETEEEKKAAEDRSAAVKASIKKKGRSKKTKSIKKKESGKSLVMMDIKPWDDETDMNLNYFGEEIEEEKKAAEDPSAAVKASIKKKGRSKKKKSIKKKESGKSLVIIKPWDDEADMKKLDEAVRSVKMESLLWGSSMCKVGGLFLNFIFMTAAKLMPALRRRKVSNRAGPIKIGA